MSACRLRCEAAGVVRFAIDAGFSIFPGPSMAGSAA